MYLKAYIHAGSICEACACRRMCWMCRITACKAGDYSGYFLSSSLWLCCTALLSLHPHLHARSGLTWLPSFSTLSPFHTLVLIMYQCFLRLGLCYSLTQFSLVKWLRISAKGGLTLTMNVMQSARVLTLQVHVYCNYPKIDLPMACGTREWAQRQ